LALHDVNWTEQIRATQALTLSAFRQFDSHRAFIWEQEDLTVWHPSCALAGTMDAKRPIAARTA